MVLVPTPDPLIGLNCDAPFKVLFPMSMFRGLNQGRNNASQLSKEARRILQNLITKDK